MHLTDTFLQVEVIKIKPQPKDVKESENAVTETMTIKGGLCQNHIIIK